jgi:hypothetical protein
MILKIDIFQTGRLKIPNAVAAPNGTDRTDEVQAYIDEFEKDILIDGLGSLLYEEVKTAYSNLENAPQRIQDLVKGKSYKVDNIDVNWEGLQDISLLAYYVFHEFLHRNTLGTFSTLGVERPEGNNSTSISPEMLLVDTYRSFYNKYQGNTSLEENTKRRSLYHFLNDNKTTYPEVEQFTSYSSFYNGINPFGI